MVPTEENHITPLKIMAEEFCGKFMFAIWLLVVFISIHHVSASDDGNV